MGRMLKLIGLVAAALVVLFVLAVLAVGMLFDPNDYKAQIADAVARATGRTLTMEGDLELSLFPRIRIVVGAAELSNAPGFGSTPFVQIEAARLQLELLPLLARRIEVGEARLVGVRLNLARNANGVNNWQDMGGAESAAAAEIPDADDPGAPAIDIGVSTVQIIDTEIH